MIQSLLYICFFADFAALLYFDLIDKNLTHILFGDGHGQALLGQGFAAVFGGFARVDVGYGIGCVRLQALQGVVGGGAI